MNHDNFTEVTSVNSPELRYIKPEIAYARGYNECLKRTNAAELLQCLIELKNSIHYEHERNRHRGYGKNWSDELNRITNAIKKATDQNK